MTLTDNRYHLDPEERLTGARLSADPDLFAVYGTLRTGCYNAALWHGSAESVGLDRIAPFVMVTNGGFPYACPAQYHDHDAGPWVVVEVLRPDPDHADALTERLDMLEGVPHHYRRIAVMTEGGRSVWLYVPAPRRADVVNRLPRIASGDWMNR